MPIEWILVIFFVFVTLLFIAIAVAFPEWVGITGRKNQEYYEQLERDGSSSAKAAADLTASSEIQTETKDPASGESSR